MQHTNAMYATLTQVNGGVTLMGNSVW